MRRKIKIRFMAGILAQAILLGFSPTCAWAGAPELSSASLSPQVMINADFFHASYSKNIKLRQPEQEFRLPENDSSALDLNGGYQKLAELVKIVPKNKKGQILISLEGDVSAGKTSLLNIIKKQGLSGISPKEIALIRIDDIINDFFDDGVDPLTAMLEVPFSIEKLIARSSSFAKIVIVEGAGSSHYLKDMQVEPDIAVFVEAEEGVRFRRHLMRYGLFAFKYFKEFYPGQATIKNTIHLRIENNTDVKPWKAGIVCVLRTAQIILGKLFSPIISSLSNISAVEKLRMNIVFEIEKIRKDFIVWLVILPLRSVCFLLKTGADLYYKAFAPHKDLVSLIKKRFGEREIRILDVGTGDGKFTSDLKRNLAGNGVEAEVIGIDLNASAVAKGLSQGRSLRVMDVKDARENFGIRSFDVITINAPEVDPAYLIEQAASTLRSNGMVILQMHKGIHFQMTFGRDFRAKLAERLGKSYEIIFHSGRLYNLPGTEYSLQGTIVLYLRKFPLPERASSRGKVLDFPGRLIEKNDFTDYDLEAAWQSFSAGDYDAAADKYATLLRNFPDRKILNFYLSGVEILRGNFPVALNFMEVLLSDPSEKHNPTLILFQKMLGLIILSEQIQEWLETGYEQAGAKEFSRKTTELMNKYCEFKNDIDFIVRERGEFVSDFFDQDKAGVFIYERLFEVFLRKQKNVRRMFAQKGVFIPAQFVAVEEGGAIERNITESGKVLDFSLAKKPVFGIALREFEQSI